MTRIPLLAISAAVALSGFAAAATLAALLPVWSF